MRKDVNGGMDKLTLQIMTDADHKGAALRDCLLRHMNSTLHNCSLEYRRHKGYAELVLGRLNVHSGKSGKAAKEWQDAVCSALAEYIVESCEEDLLRGMVRKDKRYSDSEKEEVLGYCRHLEAVSDLLPADQAEEPDGQRRRKRLLARELTGCMDKQTVLNLDGFLLFRLGKYGAELKDMLEYAADEYTMDQQYKEFISLLRYFVYIQDSKIPVAHIIHKGGHQFLLLNDQLAPIETDNLDTTFRVEFPDKDYNLEDLIVSTLIAVAPERIVIHTREPELPVIRTISQIFEERAQVCSYCRICSSMLEHSGAGPQNILSP